jgi:hypothetical protein
MSFLVFIFLISCKNEHVTKDMSRYCDCLNNHKHDHLGREQCFEMMLEIKEKYSGDNRALLQILDETDHCL